MLSIGLPTQTVIGRLITLNYKALRIILVALLISESPCMAEGQPNTCVGQDGVFDHNSTLSYAVAKGDVDNKLYLHPEHNSDCAKDKRVCGRRSYVTSGDVLAVSNSCGSWTYVQFKGAKSTIKGWVKSAQLDTLPGRVSDVNATYHFNLKMGIGVPVCEAYLQRLNAVDYYSEGNQTAVKAPYCGRPENASVPGFAKLNRVPLPLQDYNRLIWSINAFSNPSTKIPKDVQERQPDGTFLSKPFFEVRIQPADDLPIWTYSPLVDIDNDGTSDQVLIWQGFGADQGSGGCGIPYKSNGPKRSTQLAFIMKAEDGQIDEERTQAIFGNSNRPLNSDSREPSQNTFRPIGRSVSIFKYKELYYFDTFFDEGMDFENKRSNDSLLLNRLGVFLRQNGQTHQICEYLMQDNEQ